LFLKQASLSSKEGLHDIHKRILIMKTSLIATRAVAISLATAIFTSHIADASPTSLKTGSSTKPAVSFAPYELKLSFVGDASSQQSGIPNLQVYFVNVTRYELVYRWVPRRTVIFQVEYKAASEDPGKEAGWKRLTPVSAPSQPGGFADEHVEREQIRSGQEENIFLPSTPLPLLREGYYRITATLTQPGVSEFRGMVSPSTLVRSFDLAVFSKPLVIRRTATGFVEVPAAASIASAH